MAIDFPNTPTTNQIYTVGSRSWKWDGTIWAIYSNNPVLYRQDSPPSSPQEGDQWFETDTGRMFVYYGTAWVELGNATDVAGALQPSQVTALSAVTTLTSDDVFPVVDGPSGAVASSKITYGNLVTNMSSSLAPGLVLVKTQTIGSAVSSVTVTDAFSSTYSQYRIIIAIDDSSVTSAELCLSLGGITTGYFSGGFNVAWNVSTTNIFTGSRASFLVGYQYNGFKTVCIADLMNPFSSTSRTTISASQGGPGNGTSIVGQVSSTASATSVVVAPSSGTITGGTIYVYGYRNS